MMALRLELRQELQPEGSEYAGWDHFDALKKYRSQRTRNGLVHYAFAGGTGVKILLEADEVDKSRIKDPSVGDERDHKDIEIYAFDRVFGQNNPNPHDICSFNLPHPLHKLDYSRHPGSSRMYVEILKGSYFDFLTPTEDDVRIVRKGKKTYLTLSPEFLIASKVFKTKPFRRGNDDVDSLALLKRFDVDLEYLASIVRRTDFSRVFEEGDLEGLEEKLASEELFFSVKDRIEGVYGGVVPFVGDVGYENAITLLQFNPENLAISIDDFRIRETERMLKSEHDTEFRDPSFRLGWVYLASGIPMLSSHSRAEKSLRHLGESLVDRIGESKDTALARTIAIKQVASLVDKAYDPEQEPHENASTIHAVSRRLIREPWYLHVATALYKQLFEEIARGETPSHINFWVNTAENARKVGNKLL